MTEPKGKKKTLDTATFAGGGGVKPPTLPSKKPDPYRVIPSTDLGEKPTFLWAPKGECYIPEFQRSLNTEHRNNLLRKFSWSRTQPMTVGPKDERGYPLVNGQHEWDAAMHHPLVTEVPLWVVPESEYKRLVQIFIDVNRDRVNITPIGLHHAQLEGGDPDAKWVDTILSDAGLSLPRSFSGDLPPLQTAGLGALRRLKPLEPILREALSVMVRAWPTQRNAFRSQMITAVTRFIGLQRQHGLDMTRLHSTLAALNSDKVYHDAYARSQAFSAQTADVILDMLTDAYNKHLHHSKHLPYVKYVKGTIKPQKGT